MRIIQRIHKINIFFSIQKIEKQKRCYTKLSQCVKSLPNTNINFIDFTQIKSDITFHSRHLRKIEDYRDVPRVFSQNCTRCIYMHCAEYLNDWLNVGISQMYQVWSFTASRWSICALLMLMTLLINTAHKSLELTMIINYCLSVNYAMPPLLDGSVRASDN